MNIRNVALGLGMLTAVGCGGAPDNGLFEATAGGDETGGSAGSNAGGNSSGGNGQYGGEAGSGSGGEAGNGATGGNGANGGSGNTGGNTGGSGGSPPRNCDEAFDIYYELANPGVPCNPDTDDLQCYKRAPGVCCDHSVSNMEQYHAFEQAVNAVHQLCGQIACPDIECPEVPSNECEEFWNGSGTVGYYCL